MFRPSILQEITRGEIGEGDSKGTFLEKSCQLPPRQCSWNRKKTNLNCYCWWFRNPGSTHQLSLVVYPIIYTVCVTSQLVSRTSAPSTGWIKDTTRVVDAGRDHTPKTVETSALLMLRLLPPWHTTRRLRESSLTQMSHEKKPYYFPLYWLVNKDPYNGLL